MKTVATDLHAHTFYSDGMASPGALVRFRLGQGFKLIAVSDHDHFQAVRDVDRAAAGAIGVVPAAEITSVLHYGTADAEQIHVLAYFPRSYLDGDRLERTALYRRGLEVQRAWRAFVLEWVCARPLEERQALGKQALELLGPAEFPALQTLIGRIQSRAPHLYDAFRRHHVGFWLNGRALFAWSPEEVCDAIRADGGVDVVAHPVRYHDKARLEGLLRYASGVEVYTSRHAEKVAARFLAFAIEAKKHWTASSDDHQLHPYARPPRGTPLATAEAIYGAPIPADWITEEPGEP